MVLEKPEKSELSINLSYRNDTPSSRGDLGMRVQHGMKNDKYSLVFAFDLVAKLLRVVGVTDIKFDILFPVGEKKKKASRDGWLSVSVT